MAEVNVLRYKVRRKNIIKVDFLKQIYDFIKTEVVYKSLNITTVIGKMSKDLKLGFGRNGLSINRSKKHIRKLLGYVNSYKVSVCITSVLDVVCNYTHNLSYLCAITVKAY